MGVAGEFKKGIFYSALGKYSNVVIQLIVNAILSRILTPEDYGVVAIVNVFLIFFQMLADFGIGPAIIQNKTLKEKDISSIFAFSIYLALFLGIGFMALGIPISNFYSNEVYKPISIILGFCVMFYALLIVPQSILLREKKFFNVNMVTIISNVASGIVSIILAFAGFSYYALIFGNIAKAMVMFIIFFIQSKMKWNFKVTIEPLKKIYSFSKNQFAFNFINYFSRNLDKMLIGRFMNESALAYYDKAYQVSLYPNQTLTNVITPVIQPIMSEYETDRNRIKDVYLRITLVLATIGIPLSVFFFFASQETILFLFGDQWLGSVLTFQILAVSIWIQMISSSTGAIFQSANRTDLLLLSGILSAALNILSIFFGIYLGNIEYVAAMIVFSFSINFLMNNYLLMYRLFDSNLLEFFKVLIKPMIMGVMQIIVFLLLPELSLSVFFNLVIKGIVFVLVFVLSIVATGQIKMVREFIGK
ncbi:MAG: polysaccharide transporter, family [Carnobacterium sp.]|uniref:lipopolysaccharide biosynthesis protein n=1 Tax=Carnobacterium sp. TaxID=48221 RepID=UPI00264954AC|nr:lipopolysaccharide biosynthesis protein [Carnobacterium sp.]MDN5372781.1 polysaccharide transporter, family [Carnobacterium sp.]